MGRVCDSRRIDWSYRRWLQRIEICSLTKTCLLTTKHEKENRETAMSEKIVTTIVIIVRLHNPSPCWLWKVEGAIKEIGMEKCKLFAFSPESIEMHQNARFDISTHAWVVKTNKSTDDIRQILLENLQPVEQDFNEFFVAEISAEEYSLLTKNGKAGGKMEFEKLIP